MDFAAAGLLEGLEGEERDARERLLSHLAEEGADLEELKAAVQEDRLALLPVERALGGNYSATEIEERSGLSADMVLRSRRLMGLSEVNRDEGVFSEEDVEAAEAAKTFMESGLDEDTIADITRGLGESMARVAAATAAAFAEAFLEPGDTEYDVALRLAQRATELRPPLDSVVVAALSAHLRESVRRGIISATERESGSLVGAQEMAIAFADIVGFTRLGGQIEPRELSGVAGQLAELAGDVSEPPVRLVKTIGDAAMLASEEVKPLVEAVLTLVDEVEAADLPSLRGGIACGPALLRAGDLYGHTVNLASRVTGAARPGSVLCTSEVREAVPDQFRWSAAGRHKLKGIGPVRLHRVRRLDPEKAST